MAARRASDTPSCAADSGRCREPATPDMKPGSWPTALLVLAVLAAPVLAQARREPHLVDVVDAAGEPVAGAEVTLYCSDGLEAGGSEDIVRQRTDARGRALVQLQPAGQYFAFAVRAQADGHQATAVVPRASTTTELRFAGDSRLAVERLQITGLAPWRAHGPLRIECVVDGIRGLIPPAAVGDDDSVPLPPLPFGAVFARLFAGDRLVHQDLTGMTWRLPPPHAVRVQVRGTDGKPIAGAQIERLVLRWAWSRGLLPQQPAGNRVAVGTSAADGTATVLVAAPQDPFDGVRSHPGIPLVASKPGFRESWSGFLEVPFCDLVQASKTKLGGVLTFTLAPEPAASLRVVADGRPPAGLLLRAWQQVFATALHETVWLPVADDGSCRPPALASGSRPLAVVVPAVLPPSGEGEPFRRLTVPRPLVLSPEVLQGDALDLRQVVALRLSIVDAERGPAHGAEVVCTPLGAGGAVAASAAMRAVADGSGRVVLPVMPGPWLVVALLDAQWVRVRIDVGRESLVQELRLAAMPRMAVRVAHVNGKPVAGAQFTSVGAIGTAQIGAEETFLLELVTGARLLAGTTTDAEGLARVPLLPVAGVRITFRAVTSGQRSGQVEWKEQDEVQEIVLR